MKSVSFYTLGCRLNQAETAVLMNDFLQNGYRLVEFDQKSDLLIINTCTVTKNSDADTVKLVRKATKVNPQVQIALIGCQSQLQADHLLKFPGVRWVIGTERKMEVVKLIAAGHAIQEKQKIIQPILPKPFFTRIPGYYPRHTRVNIKIQDGCDFFCSYCEIPFARGRARSRDFEDILKEAQHLALSGHQELVLTGINIGMYRNQNRTFIDVIDAIEQLQGVQRIRISSIEPTTIPNIIIQKMSQKNTKLCRHLHVPIQSADDDILKLMRRKYKISDIFDFFERATDLIPDLCIGVDVMVGFPGESLQSFETTRNGLQRAKIQYFHVFSYSHRNLAKSKTLPNPVPAREITLRSQILRKLGQQKRKQFYQFYLNHTVSVLCEQFKNGFWHGLTDNFIHVKISSKKDLHNRFVRAKLIQLDRDEVCGEIVNE